MTITLARVDDRVIHGQTMTRWAASRKLDAFVCLLYTSDAADDLLTV